MLHQQQTYNVLVIGQTPTILQVVNILKKQMSVFHVRSWEQAENSLQDDVVLIVAEQQVLNQAPKRPGEILAAFPEIPWILLLPPHAESENEVKDQKNLYHALHTHTPWKSEELVNVVKRSLEHIQLQREFIRLQQQMADQQRVSPSESSAPPDAEQNSLYHELQQTLSKIVYSEKMTMLGKMVAGIAHEINTPSGAINAAIVNMSHHLKLLLESVQEFEAQEVQREHVLHIIQIVATMLDDLDSSQRRSPGEIRTEQRQIIDILQDRDLEEPRKIAKDIARMGVSQHIDDILKLADIYTLESVLRFFTNCSRIINSARDIQVSIDVLTRIIQALKSYSYPESKKPELADIHESIMTALILLNNKIKHHIQLEYQPSDVPKIWCYPSELSHVWINIIHNAIQAIEEEGQIQIETGATSEYIVVKISDNGNGIPQDIQHKIFEANFTTKPRGEGTGLGLYIAQQIIHKHQGTIEVKSEPKHTTFEVHLPLSPSF